MGAVVHTRVDMSRCFSSDKSQPGLMKPNSISTDVSPHGEINSYGRALATRKRAFLLLSILRGQHFPTKLHPTSMAKMAVSVARMFFGGHVGF